MRTSQIVSTCNFISFDRERGSDPLNYINSPLLHLQLSIDVIYTDNHRSQVSQMLQKMYCQNQVRTPFLQGRNHPELIYFSSPVIEYFALGFIILTSPCESITVGLNVLGLQLQLGCSFHLHLVLNIVLSIQNPRRISCEFCSFPQGW